MFSQYHPSSFAMSKKDKCDILAEWTQNIGTHMFWCAENCGGDANKLSQMWKSFLYHSTNRHTFPADEFPDYTDCKHAPLEETEERRRKWIQVDSKAYEKLEGLFKDKKINKDLKQITHPSHTSKLENFHSVKRLV